LLFDLEERRRAVSSVGTLQGLADGLSQELEPLIGGPLPIPPVKARLTRGGGRCPEHGDLLEFDPFRPAEHYCQRCGRDYDGADHDAWWAMGASLWTMERAVHAAALFLLRGDDRHAALSGRILSEFTARYRDWPNVDNVLGPSRPFFSTYLESIWLLNACHALSLLQAADAPGLATFERQVITGLILPSARLIAGFDEGLSNRQVWNEVAILSARTVAGDEAGVVERLAKDDGLFALFDDGLLAEGTWYEGENYHLFAHRGLWYGAELLRARNAAMDDDDVPDDVADDESGEASAEELDDGTGGLTASMHRRYLEGFVTPFLGLLPDGTFPSRRDSRYAVPIRQWRTAEWCELGYASSGDPRLAGILARVYDSGVAADAAREFASSTDVLPRARSTADAERDSLPGVRDRASLSWRALLCAREPAPAPAPWREESVCLPLQGLAAIRRDGGRTYVALEGGHTGGDHGHPDRLALTLQTGSHRWLDDPGTGSYVDRTLHWYRSTLAHAAPLVDGASQKKKPARLLAFEDRGGAGWISKRVDGIASGVECTRTVVVCDGYLVDLLEWHSERVHDITLPLAAVANAVGESQPGTTWQRADARGAGGLEDGFDFATDVESMRWAAGDRLIFDAIADGQVARLWYAAHSDSSSASTVYRANVPAAPGRGRTQRHWVTVRGAVGYIAGVWAWPDGASGAAQVVDVLFADASTPAVTVRTTDGTTAQHMRSDMGWHIDLLVEGARSSIDLDSLAVPHVASPVDAERNDAEGGAELSGEGLFADYDIPFTECSTDQLMLDTPGAEIDDAFPIPLGAAHYRGTEQSWKEAGEPTAMLQITRNETHLVMDVTALTGPVVVPVADASGALVNPLDNERADVNADGLQWYIGRPGAGSWSAAGLVVPAGASDGTPDAPRAHALVPGGDERPDAKWVATDDGWAMRLCWPLDMLPVDVDGCIALDVIVNERPAERERRRGQLVLSGGDGFAYLRGDRHDANRAVVVGVT
ncbi:MAG TPA: heparinase II/III family protein, partial [Gemmatimonas sp.]|nr:heparinase II/III family protein [Gemmatimonas sp.]